MISSRAESMRVLWQHPEYRRRTSRAIRTAILANEGELARRSETITSVNRRVRTCKICGWSSNPGLFGRYHSQVHSTPCWIDEIQEEQSSIQASKQ